MRPLYLLLFSCTLLLSPYLAAQPLIYGHRGAAGLITESTLNGYRYALELGVDVIDMDVTLSKDAVLIIAHDLFLDPKLIQLNGQWLASREHVILNYTYQELCQYQTGGIKNQPHISQVSPSRILRLEDVFIFLQANELKTVRIQIELKSDPRTPEDSADPIQMANSLLNLLDKYKLNQRVEIQSFDWQPLIWLNQNASEIQTAFLTHEDDPYDKVLWQGGFDESAMGLSKAELIAALGGDIWGPYHENLTKNQVDAAHLRNLKVIPWTVNKEADITRMLSLGVDGIISDRPDRVRNCYQKKNYPLPKSRPTQKLITLCSIEKS